MKQKKNSVIDLLHKSAEKKSKRGKDMNKLKFSTNPGLLGPLGDRFEPSGYKEPKSFKELFALTSRIYGIDGMDFWGPGQVTLENAEETLRMLENVGLKPATIVVDLWSKTWGDGSFAAKKEKTRRRAIDQVKYVMDIAAEIKTDVITVWFGHDGIDYPFQANYAQVWDWIIEGMKEVASYRKDIKIGIEYKIKEPRIHEFVGTVGDTLLLVKEIGEKNVGVTLDFGHSLAAGENMANALVRVLKEGKLFSTHWGDNYRFWDDDVIVGMVSPMEMFEVVYWLDKYNWEGWCTMDQYPFKYDAVDTISESISWIKGFQKLLDKIGRKILDDLIEKGDPTEISRTLRIALLG